MIYPDGIEPVVGIPLGVVMWALLLVVIVRDRNRK